MEKGGEREDTEMRSKIIDTMKNEHDKMKTKYSLTFKRLKVQLKVTFKMSFHRVPPVTISRW